MRLGLWALGALFVGALVAHFLLGDHGYVLITFRGYLIEMSVPALILVFVLLYGLGLVGALMAGMGLAESKRLNILYAIGFAFINALTVHFILDIEYPRQGMIRVDAIDQVLIDLMNRIR